MMTPATETGSDGDTEPCVTCGEDCWDGSEREFHYYENQVAEHEHCMKERRMAEDPNRRGIVTSVRQGVKNGKPWAFFKIDGEEDPSYSVDARKDGYSMPSEGDSIFFTYQINGAFNNVQMFEKVEPVEGEVETVAATVTATQDKREEGIHRSVALQQAVALLGGEGDPNALNMEALLNDIEKAYLRFLRLLANPASLREPGDVENHTDGAPKPVLDHNGPRDSEGYLIKASDAERASQDAQGAPVDPADPKYVSRPV